MTKLFISAVVLQLVDEGALELDGDAAPLVPGVTVRQLLNHTSGVPNRNDIARGAEGISRRFVWSSQIPSSLSRISPHTRWV